MKNKRRLSIDYFEKKMKKLHKHNNRFTDYDIHHTQLTSLLQTTSFNGLSTTDRSNRSNISHNDKDYFFISVKAFLPKDDYLHFEYFTFVPKTNNNKKKKLPKIITEPNQQFKPFKMESLSKVNESIMKNIKKKLSMNNDRSLTTTTKEIEMRREITVPNSPRNEKKDDIKTKTRKNEFDCINPRICFPSVISELKYMSNIYTQNLNYQKAFLRGKFTMKKSIG